MGEQQFFFNNARRKNGWYGLVILFVVLILLFFMVRTLFSLLYWLSPVLLILTLIFDYKVVINFAKWVWKLFRTNFLYAVLIVVLSIIGFPILTGGLFVNAFMNWRIRRTKKKFGIPEEKEPEKKLAKH